MATIVTQQFRFDQDNAEDYATADDNILGRNSFVYVYLNKTASADAYLNQDGRNQLFPTSTAIPFKMDNLMRIRRSIGGTCVAKFYINETLIQECSTSSKDYVTYTQSDISISGVNSSSSFKWTLSNDRTTRGAELLYDTITFYFYRYTHAAAISTGVNSASASSTAPYHGDQVTYSCDITSGYTFDGWYNGSTKVSSSQTYTITADSDLTLTAKATKLETFVSIKQNGAWVNASALWKKINGSWVKQTDANSIGIPDGQMLYNIDDLKPAYNWTVGSILNRSGGMDNNPDFIVSDYIPVTPKTALTFAAFSVSGDRTAIQCFQSDKSYEDYFTNNDQNMTIVDGHEYASRTLDDSDMRRIEYIRINSTQAHPELCKVWQNGVLIFDGSWYRQP